MALGDSLEYTKPFEAWWDEQESVLQVLKNNGALQAAMGEARSDDLDRMMEAWRKVELDFERYLEKLRAVVSSLLTRIPMV